MWIYGGRQMVLVGALALAVALVASPLAPLLAQEATAPVVATAASTVDPSQPAPKETVVVNQDVSIPYGQWVEDIGNIAQAWLTPLILGVGTWIIGKYVPLPLQGFARGIMRKEAEALIAKAIDYGVNATAGASHNATLTIPVGSEVAAKATNYAVQHGWPKLIEFLDGPDGILQKVFARLDLPLEATARSVGVTEPRPATQTVAIKKIKVPAVMARS